ncbi:addiction module protein, partial [Planctomycetota bacterium]
AALGLSVSDRALLVAELLASMEGEGETPEAVEKAWAREIDQRIARAKAGRTAFRDWEQVEQSLRRKPVGQ